MVEGDELNATRGISGALPTQSERGLPSLPQSVGGHARPLEVRLIRRAMKSASYAVAGRSIEEVRAFLKRRDHIGFVDFKVGPPAYDVEDSGVVTGVTIIVAYRKTLPVWPELKRQPPAIRQLWDRFVKNLDCHENDHIFIMNRNLNELEIELRSLKDRHHNKVAAVVQGAIDRHAEQQQKFHEDSRGGVVDYGFCQAAIL